VATFAIPTCAGDLEGLCSFAHLSNYGYEAKGEEGNLSTAKAGKVVNVTCWHQTVNVSAGREPHTSLHTALNADSCRSQPGSQALLGEARRSLQPSPRTRCLAFGHWPH